MITDFDLAIIGSGFAGSLLAMIARRLGRSVVLVERGQHPRFVIGESSTPLANLLLEELARRYDLPRLLPLCKWGSWQRTYPEIGCGLKRGFTFYHHTFDAPFRHDAARSNELLVAASPREGIADTHWYRPDFDHFLVREAQQLGVEYLDQCRLHGLTRQGDRWRLEGERLGQTVQLRARFVIDASGPRGFLQRTLALPELPFPNLPATQALFTHFTGVCRMAGMKIYPPGATPPYPVDDAALHHVFDGGWIWVLHFNNGLTSAGVAATDTLAKELNLAEGLPAWQRLLQRLPTVQEQFAEAEEQFSFVHLPRLSFRTGVVNGPGWALLPSAAGFVDPLLSTGFPLTLLGVGRLAEAIEQAWNSRRFDERLNAYARQTLLELAAAEQLVAALYASMNDFSVFAPMSLLYFAAASFSEMARRLGRPELASAFLLHDHPVFGPQSFVCCAEVLRGFGNGGLSSAQKADLRQKIFQTIAPIDVAGLGDLGRRNWHPVAAQDLFNAAGKLGATETEIQQLLLRCGFSSA